MRLLLRLTCSCAAHRNRCRSDDDCSLNGKCTASKQCKCRPQWSGDRCETLRLGAATRGAGYRAVDDGHNTSSWGGAVLLDETTGTYHMYASEMTAHCGIGAWAQNSRVIHATSSTPGGTYERKGVVWGVFSHEPMMARAPTGEYVMYFTSSLENATVGTCDCCAAGRSKCDGSTGPGDCPGTTTTTTATSTTSTTTTTSTTGGLGGRVGVGDSDPTWMSYASSPDGPWSEPKRVFADWHGSDTNFAPLILRNGSLLAIWRSWEATGSRCFLATAADWRDPATYAQRHEEVISTDLGTAGTEDPFVYQDAGGHFHAVFHHMYGEGTRTQWWLDTDGGHAFSRDGVKWTYSGVAWGNAEHPRETPVAFSDGGAFTFTRLERPHLVFDADGAPTHLLNAAQYGPGKDPGTAGDNGDATYTLVRPILQE